MSIEDSALAPQPEPAQPGGQEVPAAFSANGHGHPKPPTAGQATEALAQQLGQMFQALPQLLANVLAQVPLQVKTPYICATCLLGRLQWMARNTQFLEGARKAACEAAGVNPNDPGAPAIDPIPFLPPHLRPGAPDGIPSISPKATTVAGTDVCAQHVPGAPAGDAAVGRKQFLIVHAPLSNALVAEALGRQV